MAKDTAYVLQAFTALAAIPRPSKQERAVSDFLKRWAQERRLPVIQDACNNIIIEKDASPGCEHAPRVILQAHMDMVYVFDAQGAGGENPRPIRIRENPHERSLSAEGSSLGADDGIGVAMIQYLLQAKDIRHGPLRAVITTDEEAGMSGARNLDARHLDAAYLINIDWERSGSLCNSCADIHVYRFRRSLGLRKNRLGSARRLVVSGLAGGHSGIDIHKGRANALCAATQILGGIRRAGIDFELADFWGGTANNAIPTQAEAILCLDAAQAGRADRIASEAGERFRTACGERDRHARISFTPCQAPQSVLSGADAGALLGLLAAMPSGVRAASQSIPDFVESSSNLGLLRMDAHGVTVEAAARSCVPWHTEAMRHGFESLAALSGFACDIPSAAPAWPMKSGSVLTEYARAAFREICGTSMTVDPVHAGLECGVFAVKNPELDMISLGPRIDNAHSVSETLYLDGLSDTLRCIAKTLEKITSAFLLDSNTRKA